MASRVVIMFILGRASPCADNGLSLRPLPIIDRAVKNRLCHHMGLERQNFDIDLAASVLGWWKDAGVDTAISETPHDWLGTRRVANSGEPIASAPPVAQIPQSLDALVDHLMTSDLPEAGPSARRVRPTGNPDSELMILVDFPDVADVEVGELLSDPVFTKMLEAIGRDRGSAYIACLCPGRPVTGRLSAEAVDTLAVLAQQHVRLTGAKQLWLVGGAASRAILGIDDSAAKGRLHKVNHLGTITDVIATAHPRMFQGSKSRKAAAWAEMQRLVVRENG